MENFEQRLSDLFANKLLTDISELDLTSKSSLELLLEHVYKKVLVPAHYILTEQEQFFNSSLSFLEETEGDAVADGLEERSIGALKIVRLRQPLFTYWLSFDGDTEASDARLWRHVDIERQPIDIDNLPDSFWDLDKLDEDSLGKTLVDKDAADSVEEYHYFTLDMDEAVRLIQEDFYEVCAKLL
ncbi:hypothetical protein [Hymenobacter sp. PAMC 26628]|uniref:hypothetical protein n=1 Tax=Hymenobacter sp. PAMC 26628 TaxID=1484118 RepID=UPI0007701C2F|nr:hypothetical protein [Hymenobacter sp. PAMC 26628]AMJ66479.1 hypothetical protein AXW84_14350 [Hymenobacter sp. PAMC 26628]